MRIVVLLGIVLGFLGIGFLSIFIVPVDSEALILRGGEVKRKAGPGMHARIPLVEELVIEPVLRERQFLYETPFELQGCKADVSLIYRIGDLEAYHSSRRDLTVLANKRGELQTALDGVPDLSSFAGSQKPYAKQIASHLQQFSGPLASGLYVNAVQVRLEEGCEPKRIVREQPLEPIGGQQVSELAPYRALPGTLLVTTADAVELRIENFVATYDIVDELRAEQCFGQNRDLIGTRVESFAARALSEIIQKMMVGQLSEIPIKLKEALRDNELDRCGLAVGGVDFSNAAITERTIVNCDETPIEDCFTKPISVPGLVFSPSPLLVPDQ